jgi:FeS assembly protein IscX
MDVNSPPLYWDATYEIALALIDAHPNADLDQVGLRELQTWVLSLPNFRDEAALANEAILTEILREWYEEISG